MDKIKLSPRLSVVASFVQPGGVMVDVGCDHGYLPVWLLENGVIEKAVATDIHRMPLQKAVECAAVHGLQGKMTCVLTDGLQGVDLTEVNTIVIAGMGGETISVILDKAPQACSEGKVLVLQPMSKIESMLEWLYEKGFYVQNERLVEDAGEIYRVFSVTSGKRPVPDAAHLIAGEALFLNRDPLLKSYLGRICDKLRRACAGMEESADPTILDKAVQQRKLLAELETWMEELQ